LEATAGIGLPAYARVRVTDFAVAGCGMALSRRKGFHGRYGTFAGGGRSSSGGVGFHRDTIAQGGIPLVGNWEGAPRLAAATSRWSVATLGPCVTRRTYESGLEPGPRSAVAEKFWIGISVTALLSARLEFNPVELADLVCGCFGWDLLEDDGWNPRQAEPDRRGGWQDRAKKQQ